MFFTIYFNIYLDRYLSIIKRFITSTPEFVKFNEKLIEYERVLNKEDRTDYIINYIYILIEGNFM